MNSKMNYIQSHETNKKIFSRHIEFAVFTTDRDKENFNTFSNKFGQMYTQIIH